MALSVPLSRFTSPVGGGSAFFVRRHLYGSHKIYDSFVVIDYSQFFLTGLPASISSDWLTLLLCGITVFARRWTSFYSFLNLFIIISFIIYALYVDPSWLFSQHPSRWFFTVIAVQGWWIFTRYRSEREMESSHDDA